MAQLKHIIEGLQVLGRTAKLPKHRIERGETDPMTAHLGGAEHDIIYGPRADPDPDDECRLMELGWHFNEEEDVWCVFV